MNSYLILHKVRGEPAFDVAEPFDLSSGETYWIVSTSGHRAYPYKKWRIVHSLDLGDVSLDHLPDHYPTPRAVRPKPKDLTNEELLALLKEKLNVLP